MKEDITYKLQKIKYHRLIHQIEKDIKESLYSTIPVSMKIWLETKYPNITFETKYENGKYSINISIPKPVKYITNKIIINNEGIL